MKTADEHLARMEALVRKMAYWEGRGPRISDVATLLVSAKQVIAEIDGPKTDEEWAQHFLRTDDTTINALRQAIAKGRELERSSS